MSRNRQQRGGGLFSDIGRNLSQYMAEPENSTNNAVGRNVQEPPPPLPGLAELVEVLNIMGAAPTGVRPPINQELLDRIKISPLQPVINALQPVYHKLGPPETPAEQSQRPKVSQPWPTSTPEPDPSSTQQPAPPVAPNGTEAKNVEAGLQSLSLRLDSVTQAVGDVPTNSVMAGNFKMLEDNLRKVDSETRDAVNASATASQKQFEAVDTKVSQMSATLDPAFNEISHGIKKLQASLLGDVKAEKMRLETRVNELEKEVKDLHQVIDVTRTELLPVEAASKIALQGTLSEEADKTGTRTGAGNNTAPGNVVQTAKRVRTNTLGLIAKCRALFIFINRDYTIGSNLPDLGTEGEWGRCAEHLRASNTRLRSAIEEKEEAAQKLQFVGFAVDQIRKGSYTEKEWKSDINGKIFVTLMEKSPDGFASIQLLMQDLSRLAMTAPVAPIAPLGLGYGIPPGYETPPATAAADTMAFQTSVTPLVNIASADTGVSKVKPNTGGTKGRGKGRSSTNQPPATIASPATPTATTAPAPSADPAASTAPGAPSAFTAAPRATAGSRTPTGPKPPTGSRGATTRATATNSRTPAEPVEPVAPPGSTPASVVTAPTSPVIATVPTPTKHHSEIRPAPTKKSSSYFRSKSEFKRRPVSGWGLLAR